ncbi:NAD-dependent deacetylase [candidate division KSB1 bacterium]
METNDRNKLVSLIRNASSILIFTGAGISTRSGIPDYRGPQGVWKTRQPVYYQDFMSSEEARIEYWDFKLEGWEAFRNAQPNEVHKSIAQLEDSGKICMVITQNIDGLHFRAGTSESKLIEIHGTDLYVDCQTCNLRSQPEEHYKYFEDTRKPPICKCGGFLKPATISFGQQLHEEDVLRSAQAAESADLAISLGSTLAVYPAASFPLMVAERGYPYVIINRGETGHDESDLVTLRFEGDVAEIFPPAVETALV